MGGHGALRRISVIAVAAAALVSLLALGGTTAWAAGPPTATTEPATAVKRANAVLNGAVNPEGAATLYYFEYGPAACDAAAKTCGMRTQATGPVTEPVATEPLKITRLKPGTTYHFWLVASSASGTVTGAEQAFTTVVAEPKEYVFEKEIKGPNELKFTNPLGVGINQETGDVYVSDKGAIPVVIDQFNAAGEFQSSTKLPPGSEEDATFSLTVDNSHVSGHQGDVYITDITQGIVYKFKPDATGKIELDKNTPKIGEGVVSEPRGVAVDSSGNVYITSEPGTVSKFSSTGAMLSKELIKGLSSPLGLAVDAAGNIYVAEASGTVEYNPAGACFKTGVNPGECQPIVTDESQGVAVDPAGNVFLSDFITNTVKEYGPAPENQRIENIELERAGAFTEFPRGLAINDTNQTLYVVERGAVVKVFRFLNVKPVVVKTEPATQVSGPVEALNGTVNPGGQEPAEYYFEYGTEPCDTVAETCGTVAVEPSEVPFVGNEAVPVSVRLENLAPNTKYHAWIVGVNEESGVSHGEELTFTTGRPPPSPPEPPSEGSAPESGTPASSPVFPLLTSIAPVPLPKVPPVPTLTRAQRLAKALAACNRKPKRQRAACKRQARRRYGSVTKGLPKRRRK
jgi:streptogramin lyase